MKALRYLALFLLVLFVGSVILLSVFFQDASPGTFKLEVAKALLEIGIVSVTGAIVTVLVFEYQQQRKEHEKMRDLEHQEFEKQRDLDRKQLEYRDALLLSTLSKAMNAYSHAKKGRRFLRAIAIQNEGDEEIVIAAQYDTYIELIINAQLDFENLARDVETSAMAFSDSVIIKERLWDMEKYLNKLIGEYEDSRRAFLDNRLSLNELPRLKEFLLPAKESYFKPAFATPFHKVQELIRKDLLHPNLPGSSAAPEYSQAPTDNRLLA